MNYASFSDELLAKLLFAGDEPAFKEIYQRYWKKLYYTALAKIHIREVAEELVQTLFVSLWEKRNLSLISHLESYLMRAMKFKIINYIQSFITHEKHQQIIGEQLVKEESNSDKQVLIHELHLAIHQAIEKLPQKTKTVFKLSREENCSVKEIANQMNLSEKAVEYHITQSLKLLRLHLKDFMIMELIVFLFLLF